jgi:hypothetical protein
MTLTITFLGARPWQAEAETIIALAKQRRWSIEKERFERKMKEAVHRADQLTAEVRRLTTEKESLTEALNGREKVPPHTTRRVS